MFDLPQLCQIPLPYEQCEAKKQKCDLCEAQQHCDYVWIYKLWDTENKIKGDNTLLGGCIPIILKSELRANDFISVTKQYDFCMYKYNKKKDIVVIYDLYVDESMRGQHISTKIFHYLMKKYDCDLFAKCVADTSAEKFWQHVATQISANIDNPESSDMYERRAGKRPLGWYIIKNTKKKYIKQQLF